MVDRIDVEPATESTPSVSGEPKEEKPQGLGPVYFSTFLDILGVAIIIPILPYVVYEKTGEDVVKLGWITASYSAAQIVGSIIMGFLSDRVGRRKVILASIFGSATGFVVLALSVLLTKTQESSFAWLVIARVYAGLWGGSVPVSQAYVADVTTEAQRPKYLGLIGATIGTAFTIGPGIGGGLQALFRLFIDSNTGASAAVLFSAGAFSFLGFLYAVWKLKEPPKGGTSEDEVAPEENEAEAQESGNAVADELSRKETHETLGEEIPPHSNAQVPLAVVAFAIFCLNYAFTVMQSTYAIWLVDNLGWESTELALMLVGSGIVIVIIQVALIKPLTNKLGSHWLAVVGLVALAVGLTGFSFIVNAALHIAVYMVHIFGHSVANTSTIALISFYAASDGQGAAQGFGNAAAALSRVVSPIVSSALYKTSTEIWPTVPDGVLAYVAGSVLSLVSALPIVALVCVERRRSRKLEMVSA